MDIGFNVFWWLHLDHQSDVGDVEASGSDVCRHKHANLVILESLQSDFSLSLRNIAVHDLNLRIDLVRHQQGVCLGLCRCEDNRLPKTTIDDEQVRQGLLPIVVRTIDRDVVDVLLRLVFEILGEINHLPVWSQILLCHVLDPSWNGRRKKKELW